MNSLVSVMYNIWKRIKGSKNINRGLFLVVRTKSRPDFSNKNRNEGMFFGSKNRNKGLFLVIRTEKEACFM